MKAIAAMSLNRIIGNKGKIPWHISGDLKFFKKMTLNQTIVMGRKTFESVGTLPKRDIIVLTEDKELLKKEPFIDKENESSVKYLDVLKYTTKEAKSHHWICGGAQVYSTFMPWADELYLTLVLNAYNGDVTMPGFEHLFNKTDIIERQDNYLIIKYYRNFEI